MIRLRRTNAVLLFETELLRVCVAVDELDLCEPARLPFIVAAVPGPSILMSIDVRYSSRSAFYFLMLLMMLLDRMQVTTAKLGCW
jgi:hypothetical protein